MNLAKKKKTFKEISITKPLCNDIYPKTIYHYCSTESFYSIIENQTIWLCDSNHANDSLETKWIDNLIPEWKQFCKEQYPDHENSLNQACDKFLNEQQELTQFMTCFSESKDLLSQWRGYANDGKGFAIGFSPYYFLDLFDHSAMMNITNPKFFDTDFLSLIHVDYNKKDQLNLLSDLLKFSISKTTSDKNRASFIYRILKAYKTFFKNPSFKEEGEWRIIKLVNKGNMLISDNSSLKYHHSNNDKIVSHIPINFKKEEYPFVDKTDREENDTHFDISDYFNEDLARYFEDSFDPKELELIFSTPILEIVIGPKNKSSIIDIKMFLKDAGYNIDLINIKKSNIPYC